MSKRLQKHIEVLKLLKKAEKPEQRKHILNCADNGLICCICECVKNVLHGNVHLTTAKKRELAKHKDVLRKIADRKTNINKKRDLLVQKGGFLPALLGPVLGVAASLISQLVG